MGAWVYHYNNSTNKQISYLYEEAYFYYLATQERKYLLQMQYIKFHNPEVVL